MVPGAPDAAGSIFTRSSASFTPRGLKRMGVGEGVEEHGGDVAVHHRYAVLRAPPVGRLVLVEEALADEVALVVLVDPGPSEDRVPHARG